MVVYLVDRRQYAPKPFDFAPANPNDGFAVTVSKPKLEKFCVQCGATGVADEVLSREPKRPLEGPSVKIRVGPRLQFDGEIPPPWPKMFRQMFHYPRIHCRLT